MARTEAGFRSPARMIGVALAVFGIYLFVAVAATLAQSPQGIPLAKPQANKLNHDVMAIVNGKDINRQRLAHACVERFGEEVLESLVNKRLIQHHCRKRSIKVTDAKIEAEIDRMAKRFKLGREQWLELLERERGVAVEEYKRDILWPTIALRELAANDLMVSEAELKRAYETRFGPSIRTRLIVVSKAKRAQELERLLAANPDNFARLAMQESEDVNSASIGGLIQPIRRHVGDPQLERVAFALQPGEVSKVIKVGGQYALIKCEGKDPGRNVTLANVRDELTEGIKEEKLREVAAGLFKKLQDSATIKNVYNDPQLRQAMPGVVATVNGEQISMKELGTEALARHGEEVLDGEISRLLLEQELKSQNLSITQGDLEGEMRHAAKLGGIVDQQGRPDMQRWVKLMTDQQDQSYEVYVRDTVWPSAALKKLTRKQVVISDEDLQKGFQANYGERVRCRAIVLGKMRRAQEVWAKARENTSMEFFGDLATEYSIEPTSKTLRGEVPPLRKHGGQPQLEEVAFQLQPGELSGIVQIGDKFIILKCEGRTEPVEIRPEEVREVLSQDLFEKKLRMAMADRFEQMRAGARIDNYLAGTSQEPPSKQASNRRPSTRQPRRDSAVRPTSGQR